jgi:hypothetical protein
MTAREGEYYDLGMLQVFTLHDHPQSKDSGSFFVLAVSPMPSGDDLESRIASAYAVQQTAIEDMAQQPFEHNGLEGIEATYRRPWGEPWWQFRDVWFEKDGTCYLLSFSSYPNAFDNAAPAFDAILKSFKFKD